MGHTLWIFHRYDPFRQSSFPFGSPGVHLRVPVPTGAYLAATIRADENGNDGSEQVPRTPRQLLLEYCGIVCVERPLSHEHGRPRRRR